MTEVEMQDGILVHSTPPTAVATSDCSAMIILTPVRARMKYLCPFPGPAGVGPSLACGSGHSGPLAMVVLTAATQLKGIECGGQLLKGVNTTQRSSAKVIGQ